VIQTSVYGTNNIDSQLDATVTFYLIIPISSTYFVRWFCPSSGALDCVYSLWYITPTMLPAGGRQHRECIIPQAVNTV